MVSLKQRRVARKRNHRKFTPSFTADEKGARLESRAVAAPALWMDPAGVMGNLTATRVWGWGTSTTGAIISNVDQSTNGVGGSMAAQVLDTVMPGATIPIPGGGTWVIPQLDFRTSGLAVSQVVDLANPGNGSGFTNIGNFAVSGSNNVQLQWGPANFPPGWAGVNNTLNAAAAWSRSYILADTNAAPPGTPPGGGAVYNPVPVYLHEVYTLDYNPAPAPSGLAFIGSVATIGTGPGIAPGGMPTGGIVVATIVNAADLGLPAINFENTAIAAPAINPGTGSGVLNWTNPATGNLIHVSRTATTLRISTSIQIAGLPYTTATGVVAGPSWHVRDGVQLTAAGTGISGQSSMASLTSNYNLNFSNFPTTT